MYFQYGDKEIEYLRSKDKKLAEVIDKVGHIDRTVDTDLFSSTVMSRLRSLILLMRLSFSLWV
jgi:hypothetical protein